MSGTVDRIKSLMREQNITAAELSRAAGLSHSTISRYLSGKVEPKPNSIRAIAKALHVSEVHLIVSELDTDKNPASDFLLQFATDPDQHIIIHNYVSLSPEHKKQVEDYIAFLLSQQGSDPSEADS